MLGHARQPGERVGKAQSADTCGSAFRFQAMHEVLMSESRMLRRKEQPDELTQASLIAHIRHALGVLAHIR